MEWSRDCIMLCYAHCAAVRNAAATCKLHATVGKLRVMVTRTARCTDGAGPRALYGQVPTFFHLYTFIGLEQWDSWLELLGPWATWRTCIHICIMYVSMYSQLVIVLSRKKLRKAAKVRTATVLLHAAPLSSLPGSKPTSFWTRDDS